MTCVEKKAATTAVTSESCAITDADILACVPHLRAFARCLTGHRVLADDLVKDVIVETLTAAHQLQPGPHLNAWMFTKLRTLHSSPLRKNRAQTRSLNDQGAREPVLLLSHETDFNFGNFRHAFWQLGDEQREVLILVEASGLSHEEVAQVCECSPDTIRNRVSRARHELMRVLQESSPAHS